MYGNNPTQYVRIVYLEQEIRERNAMLEKGHDAKTASLSFTIREMVCLPMLHFP